MSAKHTRPTPTSVNFLPEWYQKRRRGQRILLYQVIIAVGLVLGFGALVGREIQSGHAIENKHRDLRQQFESLRRKSQ